MTDAFPINNESKWISWGMTYDVRKYDMHHQTAILKDKWNSYCLNFHKPMCEMHYSFISEAAALVTYLHYTEYLDNERRRRIGETQLKIVFPLNIHLFCLWK